MNILSKIALLPFGLLYSLGIRIRNLLFDLGIMRSKSYPFPVITIGNLSVGGTGKTPHTEFLLTKLKAHYRLAVLSRGYGRKSSGFRLVGDDDSATTVGDEPYQMFKKFREITFAVDENRRRGIEKLKSLPSPPQVILLDDAFQHRKVKAGLNILLTDYSDPYTKDFPLPAGGLREPRTGAKRADLIVVTKSPAVLSPLEIRRITSIINPEAYQKVFFSYIKYRKLIPLSSAAYDLEEIEFKLKEYTTLLVTAIANNKPLQLFLKRKANEVESLNFRDHHYFTEKDYKTIQDRFTSIFSSKKLVIITEKDAVKLDWEKLPGIPVFVIPMQIEFHKHAEEDFIQEVIKHVRSYTTSG